LINLEDPAPTKRHLMVGTERGNLENFVSLNQSEMAFSKSSLPLLLGPFINSFIMICESKLSVSQDGLLREICCYQNIDYRYLILYIYIRFQILLVSKSIGFFLVGAKIIHLIKHWVGGLFPPASYALSGH
jgi:hypothetical protein